jgi:hypothetical protein
LKRFVVWGGRESLDSIRHVLRHYYDNACKLGIPSVWLPNEPRSAGALTKDDTILAVDVASDHLPHVRGARYVLHNFDGADPLCVALEPTPERLLRLQVWTNDATGEEWDTCRQFDRDARTLFQPWGTDLLAEEFMDPVFEPMSRRVVFVGAVWSDQYQGVELGNEGVIGELTIACQQRGLVFEQRTHVPDAENVRAVRQARLAPALAGAWQVGKGYVPCRALKNVSYGALGITNVPSVKRILGAGAVEGESVNDLVGEALGMNRTRYLNLVREQQRQVQRYTYRESIASIQRAFGEIAA